jgi:hypothetical protein
VELLVAYDLVNKKVTINPAVAGATATDLIVVHGISAPSSLILVSLVFLIMIPMLQLERG